MIRIDTLPGWELIQFPEMINGVPSGTQRWTGNGKLYLTASGAAMKIPMATLSQYADVGPWSKIILNFSKLDIVNAGYMVICNVCNQNDMNGNYKAFYSYDNPGINTDISWDMFTTSFGNESHLIVFFSYHWGVAGALDCEFTVSLTNSERYTSMKMLTAGSYDNIGDSMEDYGIAKTINWDGNGQVFFGATSFKPTTNITMTQRPGYTGNSCVGWQMFSNLEGEGDAIMVEEYSNNTLPVTDVTRLFAAGNNDINLCLWGGGDPPYTGFTCNNMYLFSTGVISDEKIPLPTPQCRLDIVL